MMRSACVYIFVLIGVEAISPFPATAKNSVTAPHQLPPPYVLELPSLREINPDNVPGIIVGKTVTYVSPVSMSSSEITFSRSGYAIASSEGIKQEVKYTIKNGELCFSFEEKAKRDCFKFFISRSKKIYLANVDEIEEGFARLVKIKPFN